MKETYPTWNRISNNEIVSLEGQDDGYGHHVPDFCIFRIKKRWFVKWRTAAHTNAETFDNASKAMRSIETQFK